MTAGLCGMHGGTPMRRPTHPQQTVKAWTFALCAGRAKATAAPGIPSSRPVAKSAKAWTRRHSVSDLSGKGVMAQGRQAPGRTRHNRQVSRRTHHAEGERGGRIAAPAVARRGPRAGVAR
jgi:hypothetical protein